MKTHPALVMTVLISIIGLPVLRGEWAPPGNDWPTTLEAAVEDILGTMSEEDKEVVRQTRYEDLIQYHHGLGAGIRNELGLWRGNDALIRSACGKPCHPDTASMRIIEAVWRALQR